MKIYDYIRKLSTRWNELEMWILKIDQFHVAYYYTIRNLNFNKLSKSTAKKMWPKKTAAIVIKMKWIFGKRSFTKFKLTFRLVR